MTAGVAENSPVVMGYTYWLFYISIISLISGWKDFLAPPIFTVADSLREGWKIFSFLTAYVWLVFGTRKKADFYYTIEVLGPGNGQKQAGMNKYIMRLTQLVRAEK